MLAEQRSRPLQGGAQECKHMVWGVLTSLIKLKRSTCRAKENQRRKKKGPLDCQAQELLGAGCSGGSFKGSALEEE